MVRFVSSNTLAKLSKEPHLLLQDWLYANWLTVADNTNYPGLSLRDKIAYGYHWSDRQRAGKKVTLRTRAEPEITKHYLTQHLHDYNQRVWIDFYLRDIDTVYTSGIPQLPATELTVMRNFIRDIVETNPHGLQANGIHAMEYEKFEEIPNPEEANIFHGICFVRLIYRLVGQ